MTLEELITKAKDAEAAMLRCQETTGHLFQAYHQQLSSEMAYLCLNCGLRRSEELRRKEERDRQDWFLAPNMGKPSTYLPPDQQ